jgi:methionyl-tRNA formyltransferase
MLNELSETGATIITVEENFDTGLILQREIVPIPQHITYPQLSQKLATIGGNLLLHVLKNFSSVRLLAQPQSSYQTSEQLTYATKIPPSLCELKWETLTSNRVYTLFLTLGHLGLYSFIQSSRGPLSRVVFKKFDFILPNEKLNEENVLPGSVIYEKQRKILYIKCNEGWIGCTELAIQGGKRMNAQEFANGHLLKTSSSSIRFFSPQTSIQD